jgi:hypothetical protein
MSDDLLNPHQYSSKPVLLKKKKVPIIQLEA